MIKRFKIIYDKYLVGPGPVIISASNTLGQIDIRILVLRIYVKFRTSFGIWKFQYRRVVSGWRVSEEAEHKHMMI